MLVTRLCVTRTGCYLKGSAPPPGTLLHLCTPTCAPPPHTTLLLNSSEPLHHLSGHLLISKGTELKPFKGLAVSHQGHLEVSYRKKDIEAAKATLMQKKDKRPQRGEPLFQDLPRVPVIRLMLVTSH